MIFGNNHVYSLLARVGGWLFLVIWVGPIHSATHGADRHWSATISSTHENRIVVGRVPNRRATGNVNGLTATNMPMFDRRLSPLAANGDKKVVAATAEYVHT